MESEFHSREFSNYRSNSLLDESIEVGEEQDLDQPVNGVEEENSEQFDHRQYSDYNTEHETPSHSHSHNHSHNPSNYPEQDLNGPVNRQIRIYVKTVSERMEESHGESPVYNDNITRCNANARCRKFGIPIPRGYWTRLWMVRDCGGWTGAVFTWILIIGGETLVMFVLAARPVTYFTWMNVFLSIFTAVLGTISHLRAMFTDPGAVPRGNATIENISQLGLRDGQTLFKCPKCDCIKPDRAHHCSVCRRCIRKMDHHCPWINNCVGEKNQKFFVLFTLYISVISWHALVVAVYTLVSCALVNFQDCVYGPTVFIVLMILLVLEGLMFGIFTCVMCCTQMSSICSDETYIEQRKKETKYEKRTCWWNVRQVFGEKFSFRWFSPFHSPPCHEDEAAQLSNFTGCYTL